MIETGEKVILTNALKEFIQTRRDKWFEKRLQYYIKEYEKRTGDKELSELMEMFL